MLQKIIGKMSRKQGMRLSLFSLILLPQVALLLFPLAAFALFPKDDSVAVAIVSEVESLKPRGAAIVGVHFTFKSPWHVYWKNPGDSGLPTRVALTLPEGVSARELPWPTPIRFEQAGGLEGFGYEKELLLRYELKASEGFVLQENSKLEIVARWLGCSPELCVPGKKSFEVNLSNLSRHKTSEVDFFKTWSLRSPVESVGAESPAEVNSKREGNSFFVSIQWKEPVEKATWIPELDRDTEVEGLSVKSSGNMTNISYTLVPNNGLEAPAINSIVSFYDSQSVYRGLSISNTAQK